ncbi:MAG: DUF3108 domain-containing protein [Nitrospinae bacterium]|nr:DUF3108 domain-containing protein [Nitrospinota bacterium]
MFVAKWWFFDAGMVETSVPEIVTENGRRYARLSLHTWSTNTIARIYKMDDYFETMWDVDSFVPKSFVAKIRESHATRDKRMSFDHERGTVEVVTNNESPKEFPIKPMTQDFFSASFLTRMEPLAPKTTFLAPLFEDNKNYDARIYSIKKERIPVLDGQLDTVMIIGRLGFEGAFDNGHNLYIWLSDDAQHVPVKLEMGFAWGSVVLHLAKAEGVDLKIVRPEKKAE